MGKVNVNYQELYDSFFVTLKKPMLSLHGDMYVLPRVVLLTKYFWLFIFTSQKSFLILTFENYFFNFYFYFYIFFFK